MAVQGFMIINCQNWKKIIYEIENSIQLFKVFPNFLLCVYVYLNHYNANLTQHIIVSWHDSC